MSNFRILSAANTKLAKSIEYGFFSIGLTLMPGNASGHEVCHFRSDACTEGCLGTTSGLATVYSSIEESRIRKTQRLFSDRSGMLADIVHDMRKACDIADSLDLQVHYRGNVLSDLDWRNKRWKHRDGWTLFDKVEELQLPIKWSDYTKDFSRAMRELRGGFQTPWHNVFSWSGENATECEKVLRAGGQVAIPFDVKRGKQLPQYWNGWQVIDGDRHDLQFLHRGSVVIGLHVKGSVASVQSGFVIDASEQLVNDRLYSLV